MRTTSIRVLLGCFAFSEPALADYAIYLNFDSFDLNAFVATGAPCSDVEAVKALITAGVVRDFAAYEVQVTTLRPANHHVQVDFGGLDGTQFGTSNPPGGPNSFNNWQSQYHSRVVVYTDFFAQRVAWQGLNGTCARIARAITRTASHEVGHNLWLRHENANRSCPGPGVFEITDDEPWRNTMLIGSAATEEVRATVDTVFSATCSNVILTEELKTRNYHSQLGNLRGDGRADLLKADVVDLLTLDWSVHPGVLSSFSSPTFLATLGRADSLFLTGDTNGDGYLDLLQGVGVASCSGACTTMWWFEYANQGGDGFAFANLFTMGAVGDRYRLADVDGDGRADLVRGASTGNTLPGSMNWSVRKRLSASWGTETTFFANSAGPQRQTWVVDMNLDGKADLVRVRAVDNYTRRYQPACNPNVEPACVNPQVEPASSRVTFNTSPSTGSAFGTTVTMRAAPNAGLRTDTHLFGDLSGDGRADLIQGRSWTTPGGTVWWDMYAGNTNVTLNARTTAHVSLGEAGALYRLGNVNNDSRVDLLWGRPSNGWTWRGALGAGGHVFGNSYITRGTTDPEGTVYP